MKTKQDLLDAMKLLGACAEATEWVTSQAGTAQDIWDRCERGDWMLWLAGRMDVDRKLLVKAACLCAREALVHVPAGENRPRIAIETAERWARGEATIDDVRRTATAAYAARAANAAANAAAYAAAAYADAAYAATAATYATYAADAADADADASAARAAREASLRRSAELVRTVIPNIPQVQR